MSSAKLLIGVMLLLLLTVVSSQAQTPRSEPPAAPRQQLTVRIVLPTTVGLIGEYADILLSKDEDKLKKLTTRRRPRTSNPTLTFSVPLPKSWLTRKIISE